MHEGKLCGSIKSFPIKLKILGLNVRYICIKTEEELFEYLEKCLEDEFNKDKKFSEILNENGIEPLQVVDERSISIIKNYEFCNGNYSIIDNDVWFECVFSLNQIYKKYNRLL